MFTVLYFICNWKDKSWTKKAYQLIRSNFTLDWTNQYRIEFNFSSLWFFSCFNFIANYQSDNTHTTTAEQQTSDKKNHIAIKSIISGAGAGLWYNNKTSKFIYANERKKREKKPWKYLKLLSLRNKKLCGDKTNMWNEWNECGAGRVTQRARSRRKRATGKREKKYRKKGGRKNDKHCKQHTASWTTTTKTPSSASTTHKCNENRWKSIETVVCFMPGIFSISVILNKFSIHSADRIDTYILFFTYASELGHS